jgi:hypothetical protein
LAVSQADVAWLAAQAISFPTLPKKLKFQQALADEVRRQAPIRRANLKGIPMKNSLKARRLQLLHKLARVNHQIVKTQKSLAAIDKRMALLQQVHQKAA